MCPDGVIFHHVRVAPLEIAFQNLPVVQKAAEQLLVVGLNLPYRFRQGVEGCLQLTAEPLQPQVAAAEGEEIKKAEKEEKESEQQSGVSHRLPGEAVEEEHAAKNQAGEKEHGDAETPALEIGKQHEGLLAER